MIGRKIVPALVFLLFAVATVVATAQPAEQRPNPDANKGQFLRLVRNDKKTPTALEAAIVRLVLRDDKGQEVTVDLVSAVHVAEKSYYQRLNREFRDYDVVLYELVAPEGTRVPKGGGDRRSAVSMLQGGMKDVLELEFQLEQIDYTRKNMVHADMSPEQFAKSMKDRDESMFTMFLRMWGYAIAKQYSGSGGAGDLQLLAAFFDKNRALALKRVMAEQFEDMEGSLVALEGPDGSTLISERNKVALEVLRKQIDAGKRKIAIFYGAGHMPDFQTRLGDQFGLVPQSTRWLVAWNLK
ncbi:MAG TPA: hypothetical protein VMY42_21625 [Thermoguttaceae bacterium]|nr:hypothetical protein [Thermoguttaceae bacterium]